MKKLWASIINDARFYDGTPQMLTQLTEHFMKHYTVSKKLKRTVVKNSKSKHKIKKKNKQTFSEWFDGWDKVIKNM